jgi:AraC-like DNA-binding protein
MTQVPVFRQPGKTYHGELSRAVVAAAKRDEVRMSLLSREDYPGKPLRRSDLPGVLAVGWWDTTGGKISGLGWHHNEGIELNLLETGSMPFAVGGREYLLKPGDLAVVRPWQSHSIGMPHLGPGRLHLLILDVGIWQPHQAWKWPPWLVMTPEDIRDLTRLLSHNERPIWSATPAIVGCFQRIARAVATDRRGSSVSMLTAYLNELFVLVLGLLRKQKVTLDPRLASSRRTAEMFLNELRRSPEQQAELWTLEKMAERCGMGIAHFGNLCKQITNMTPMRYLNHCRVETASAILVRAPERTITDVAFSCGFQSSQYFATVFRRLKGMSPREIRERAQ